MEGQVVFATPWFEVVAKHPPGYDQPHYSICTQDYVMVVAVTTEGRFLLVRQFRPAVGVATLEFPSGHVERGETPAQAARKELLEETGHVAPELELLGELAPDTGRWATASGVSMPAMRRRARIKATVPSLGSSPFCSRAHPSNSWPNPTFSVR